MRDPIAAMRAGGRARRSWAAVMLGAVLALGGGPAAAERGPLFGVRPFNGHATALGNHFFVVGVIVRGALPAAQGEADLAFCITIDDSGQLDVAVLAGAAIADRGIQAGDGLVIGVLAGRHPRYTEQHDRLRPGVVDAYIFY